MATVILFIIIAILIIFFRSVRDTREHEAFNQLSLTDKKKVVSERQRKLEQTDELITVILPTINHDK